MLGGIYTDQKCQICGSGMKDDGRTGVSCPTHKKQRATTFIVRFGRKVIKRFSSYEEAQRYLNELRYQVDKGKYDPRDHQPGNLNGFRNLVEKYLEVKEEEVSAGSFVHIKRDLNLALEFFGNCNVKDIQYGHLQDFLGMLRKRGLAGKTIHNTITNLKAFYTWVRKRRVLSWDQIPEFPIVKFELGYRKTVDKATQEAILDEIKQMSQKNPRAWIAIRFLATYIHLRPGDIRVILEEDVNLDEGKIEIRHHKTRKFLPPKPIYLLPEDVELLRSLPRGFPNMPLFRRDRGEGGHHAGTGFGKHILYDRWIKACRNLGIEGVDLYAGTRHSAMQNLIKLGKSPEEVKRISLHLTNKALNRYIEISPNELLAGAALNRDGSSMVAPGTGNTKVTPKEKSRLSRIGSPG